MSIQAVSWVLDHSDTRGAERLVLISIANHISADTCEAFPSLSTIAHEAGLHSKKVAQRIVSRLVESGKLERDVQGAPDSRIRPDKRPNLYRIAGFTGGIPDAPGNASGGHRQYPAGGIGSTHGGHPQCPAGGIADAPKPSVNRKVTIKEPSAPGAEVPESLRTPEFLAAWEEWIQDRKTRKKAITPIAMKKQLKMLSAFGAERAVRSIEKSIANGWQGLFEPEERGTSVNGAVRSTESVWSVQKRIEAAEEQMRAIRMRGNEDAWGWTPANKKDLEEWRNLRTVVTELKSGLIPKH